MFFLPALTLILLGRHLKLTSRPYFPGTMTGGGSKVMKGRMGSSLVTEISEEEVSISEIVARLFFFFLIALLKYIHTTKFGHFKYGVLKL